VAASIPQTIDRFTIQRLLGEGSQGVVYLAHDPDLQRAVAIKSVGVKYDLRSGEGLEQLVSEARTVSRLQHANVVSIFDIGMHEQRPYLVLEFIDGQLTDVETRSTWDLLTGEALHGELAGRPTLLLLPGLLGAIASQWRSFLPSPGP